MVTHISTTTKATQTTESCCILQRKQEMEEDMTLSALAAMPQMRMTAETTLEGTTDIIEEEELKESEFVLSQEQEVRYFELMRIWEQRGQAARRATTKQWQMLCERMLPLLVLSKDEQLETITRFKPRTAEKCWRAAQYAEKQLMLDVLSPHISRLLRKRSIATPTPEIYAATATDMNKLEDSQDPLMWAVTIAFGWGQRICDVLRLKTQAVHFSDHPPRVTATFHIHKTMGNVDPYTLGAPPTSAVWKSFEKALKAPRSPEFIFLEKLEDLQQVSATLLRKMRSLTNQPLLSQKAVRRGGLQRLAANASTSTVLLFSRHTSVSALQRYLNWGCANLEHIKAMMDAMK